MNCTTCLLPFIENGGCELFGDNPPDVDPTTYGITADCATDCQTAAVIACNVTGGNHLIDQL